MNKFFTIIVVFIATLNGFTQIPPPVGMDSNYDTQFVAIKIPEIALLDLEAASGTTISLSPTIPLEAGDAISFSQINSSIWLNYSSIIGSITDPSRLVTVQMTAGAIPSGTYLEVVANAYLGSGDGLFGIPTQAIILSNTPQNIINNIGSVYTGDGINNGHNLFYKLALLTNAGSYALLDFDESTALEITYTLSDN